MKQGPNQWLSVFADLGCTRSSSWAHCPPHTAHCTLPRQSLQNSTFASSIELAMKKVNTRACQNKSISDYVAILVFFGRFLKNWTHLVKIEAPILYETDLRYHTTKKFQNIDMIGVTFVFLTPYQTVPEFIEKAPVLKN